jgi:outer membrane protein TolC
VVSYLNVVTAQNIELTSENATAQILGRRMSSAVSLLRDIGGGWSASQLPTGSGLRSTFPSGSHVEPPAR